ncbi:MAG: sterol carrier protein domain-containing protein, partial [Candidatus Heimdallarchaeota archaeon]
LWDGDDYHNHESGGPMFRIIDVEKAIESLEFNKQINDTFSIKIEDEFAPWNNDVMKIEIIKGKAKVSRVKEQEADLHADIKAFTQLFIGYRSLDELLDLEKIKVNTDSRDKISKTFPKRITRLHTSF